MTVSAPRAQILTALLALLPGCARLTCENHEVGSDLYGDIVCAGTISTPLPVFHRTSSYPPRAGEVVAYDYLVLGPEADSIEVDACKWGMVQGGREFVPLYPCRKRESEPWTTLQSQGRFERILALPDEEVPEHCAEPSQWRSMSWADRPIPPSDCLTYNAWRMTIRYGDADYNLDSSVHAVRSEVQPDYVSLQTYPWSLDFTEADDGTFTISGELELPDDSVSFGRSQSADGSLIPVGMIHLLVERGDVLEPAVFEMQVPDDNQVVRSRLVLSAPPTSPVRLRVALAADRPWPSGETISYVLEVYWDAAARAWSYRTLLPFDP